MSIKPITDFFVIVFKDIHNLTPNSSYGITVILFTLLVKILLLPFNIMQTKSTAKMQKVQPKLQELQKRYKNDPKKLQEEQMRIYKEEGANPLSGCLPLLIQLPILIGIYQIFQVKDIFAGSAAAAQFLWVSNIAAPDPYFLMPIISGISQFISTKLITPKMSADDKAKNPMSSDTTNIMMSAFTTFIAWKLPAGLVLYWIMTNIVQLAIQFVLNRVYIEKPAKADGK